MQCSFIEFYLIKVCSLPMQHVPLLFYEGSVLEDVAEHFMCVNIPPVYVLGLLCYKSLVVFVRLLQVYNCLSNKKY